MIIDHSHLHPLNRVDHAVAHPLQEGHVLAVGGLLQLVVLASSRYEAIGGRVVEMSGVRAAFGHGDGNAERGAAGTHRVGVLLDDESRGGRGRRPLMALLSVRGNLVT